MNNATRKPISKYIKTLVWNEYVGRKINEVNCLCCNKKPIHITAFVCGHIQAVAEGGSNDIENLRPICAECNSAMKTQNMREFMIRYGLNLSSPLILNIERADNENGSNKMFLQIAINRLFVKTVKESLGASKTWRDI